MSESSSLKQVSRNDFVKVVTAFLGTVMGGIIGVPAISYFLGPALGIKPKDAWVPLGPLQDYPIGVPTLFTYNTTQVNGWERTVNSYGVYVVRSNEDQARVFSNICTHLSCRVRWHPELQHYISPCHDGHFDTLGNVISGPPPRPLDEFVTKIEDGNLFIQNPPYKRS